MKRENNKGSIVKVKNRRKQFKVTVTVGYDYQKGTQLRKCLGYYETSLDAELALNEYFIVPSAFELKRATFSDVHDMFIKAKKTEGVLEKTLKSYKYNFNHCRSLHNFKITDIKLPHIQNIFNLENNMVGDKGKLSTGSLKVLRTYINQIMNYSRSLQIISDNPTEFVVLPKHKRKYVKEIFTKDEITMLWNHCDIENVDTILILIYTGLRIEEFLELEVDKHIDIDRMLITHGKKTDAGRNRVIPIHHRIRNFIIDRIEANNTYLVQGRKGKESKMRYNYYLDFIFKPLMQKFNMKHTPHDCRHTFASLLDNANVNGKVISDMMGHSDFLTTKKHYIHKDLTELKKGINQIN